MDVSFECDVTGWTMGGGNPSEAEAIDWVWSKVFHQLICATHENAFEIACSKISRDEMYPFFSDIALRRKFIEDAIHSAKYTTRECDGRFFVSVVFNIDSKVDVAGFFPYLIEKEIQFRDSLTINDRFTVEDRQDIIWLTDKVIAVLQDAEKTLTIS